MSTFDENGRREINRLRNVDGNGVFGIAKVIGRADHTNQGRIRIDVEALKRNVEDSEQVHTDAKNKEIERYKWAELLSPIRGEGHGVYCVPEYGDYVFYTYINKLYIILGSINSPSLNFPGTNIPVEAQNMQNNSLEYNSSHWPNLTTRGLHLAKPVLGDVFQPASFLHRWRKNDHLIYNTTKIHDKWGSTAKLVEHRSAENNFLQMVDIGNHSISPGTAGRNHKKYSPVRQTDYRDLWEGFNINKEFWTQRTDKPPLSHESQYIKLATNGHDYHEEPHPDTGADLPDKVRGEIRLDDRMTDGTHETSKTYCPIYQTLKVAKGDERYVNDKIPKVPWIAGAPFRKKLKKWIEDTGDKYDPENQHFNVGHYLTLSNTIYKRRAMLSTKKGHQLVMSDIDFDEKVLLNSYRGKHIYMEDGLPDLYDAMWFASQKHHMLFVDHMQTPYLIDDMGEERHRLLDPNQIDFSSYQLIQTEAYQKIWLADSPLCPRIHAHTTSGHELLLLDHDQGTIGHMQASNKGKIQLTTNDKMMQITMDVENGDITIQNHNLAGKGAGGKPLTGDISIYAANNLLLHADNMIQMRANLGYDIQSSSGSYNVVACGISHSTPCGAPTIPEVIRPSVLTDIDVTEGALINKFDPS